MLYGHAATKLLSLITHICATRVRQSRAYKQQNIPRRIKCVEMGKHVASSIRDWNVNHIYHSYFCVNTNSTLYVYKVPPNDAQGGAPHTDTQRYNKPCDV